MNAADLRLIFAGTPDFAAAHLQALLDAKLNVVAVYTQPDRPAGRGHKLAMSAVKQLALQHELPVSQPASLKSPEAQAELAALKPDLMVVVAYGLILPQSVLDIPRLGCINSHASLLPRWRGAAPIQRAIEAGDSQSGVTIMQMEAGLDTGPMLLKQQTAISPEDTGGSLHDRLALLGATALPEAINGLAQGTLSVEVQDDAQACYAHKLSKADGLIDWQLPAAVLVDRIRAFNPWPLTQARLQDTVIKLWAAELSDNPSSGQPGEILAADRNGLVVACGDGALRLIRMQLPGGKPLTFADLYNARRDQFTPGLLLENGQ
ncbi:methionyl-tRNA formyltransferase [Halopseudomonas salegens]|uniref:Methionyl-tRNA formyltransferase n=1 Tax=Halopseudomonas salegens TaxID=1434072 RepID=A0A1H2HMY1_9GAMM|nr:methionyl-tRNA formyltransferase [Halopseudomonas salegens]SDU33116.1 methionyl-tRNA formyltransferase [Halopseudomonas salegens]